MIRKLLAFCAALALACAPAYAAGWYPGFTGTGQVAPGTGGATPAVTSGTFYGDSSYASAAPAFDWRWLVAYNQSYATQSAASTGGSLAYAMMYVCGGGATGGAPVSTCSAVYANATTGLPDFANAVVVASATSANIGTKQSLTPASGTTASNPCFGADGNCRSYNFDQISQLAGTVPTAPTGAVGSRPYLYQSCANFTGFSTANTNPCIADVNGGQAGGAAVTYPNSGAQPYTMFGSAGAAANAKYYQQSTSAANPYVTIGSPANTLQANAGTTASATASVANLHAYNVLFNGANSLIQVDQAASSGVVNLGTGAITGTYAFLNGNNNVSFGFSLHSGSLTPAQQAAANKLMSTTFGGTGSATSF